jgi:hypothetical protein
LALVDGKCLDLEGIDAALAAAEGVCAAIERQISATRLGRGERFKKNEHEQGSWKGGAGEVCFSEVH